MKNKDFPQVFKKKTKLRCEVVFLVFCSGVVSGA